MKSAASGFFAMLAVCFACRVCVAAENWQTVLNRMPLEPAVAQLNRTNCVRVMLGSFRSNDTIKALIFLPGATDEFYMFRRAQAEIRNEAPTLLDAVSALTNQTRICATFRAAFLLLHTRTDPLEPLVNVLDQKVAGKLGRTPPFQKVTFNDTEWDSIQPLLKRTLGLDVKPWRHSPDSHHFYRCAFSGYDLSGRQMIEAVALASQTCVDVERRGFPGGSLIRFESDLRIGNGEK